MTRPTRWYVVLALLVIAGVAAYFVSRSSYNSLPEPGIFALVWLALFAIAETYVATLTRARLRGQAGTRAIQPLVVARYVALAKASSVVGALAAGGYTGYLIWVVRIGSPAANRDTRVSAVGAGFAVLLVAAALFLEYVCRVPGWGDDDEEGQ